VKPTRKDRKKRSGFLMAGYRIRNWVLLAGQRTSMKTLCSACYWSIIRVSSIIWDLTNYWLTPPCHTVIVAAMSSTHRLHTFFVPEGDIFPPSNSSIIPIVPLKVPIDPQNLDSAEVLTPCWADARYPGFPFIALSPRFDVEPFRCLSPPQGVFPVEDLGSS
jgi:hypothetical protein